MSERLGIPDGVRKERAWHAGKARGPPGPAPSGLPFRKGVFPEPRTYGRALAGPRTEIVVRALCSRPTSRQQPPAVPSPPGVRILLLLSWSAMGPADDGARHEDDDHCKENDEKPGERKAQDVGQHLGGPRPEQDAEQREGRATDRKGTNEIGPVAPFVRPPVSSVCHQGLHVSPISAHDQNGTGRFLRHYLLLSNVPSQADTSYPAPPGHDLRVCPGPVPLGPAVEPGVHVVFRALVAAVGKSVGECGVEGRREHLHRHPLR